jgi:tight adherence protein C
MFGLNIMDLLFDPSFLATASAAIFAFATILTLGLPMVDRDTLDQRMKAVAEQRERLRAERQAGLNTRRGGALRSTPVGSTKMMAQILERFNLARLVESDDTREKLSRAGLRGQTPLTVFMFFRFVMPFLLFVAALIYFFFLTNFHWTSLMKLAASIGAALLGFYSPDVFVSNLISKRRESIMQAFPDALDLLLICVESGMSVEAAFTKVAAEIGATSPVLAEEFALTTAELSYLPDRRQAFENLAKRAGHDGVQAVATALNQAEKYGTPLGQALRICAQENRDMRMAEAEKKAAALPAKLTVPMIIFFLPCLFVVILGPAMMKVSHMM